MPPIPNSIGCHVFIGLAIRGREAGAESREAGAESRGRGMEINRHVTLRGIENNPATFTHPPNNKTYN